MRHVRHLPPARRRTPCVKLIAPHNDHPGQFRVSDRGAGFFLTRVAGFILAANARGLLEQGQPHETMANEAGVGRWQEIRLSRLEKLALVGRGVAADQN